MGKIEWAMWANEQAVASSVGEKFNHYCVAKGVQNQLTVFTTTLYNKLVCTHNFRIFFPVLFVGGVLSWIGKFKKWEIGVYAMYLHYLLSIFNL